MHPTRLALAVRPPARDPWERMESWRRHPVFSFRHQVRNMFPGFGIATVAFAAYCTWEHFEEAKLHDAHKSEHH